MKTIYLKAITVAEITNDIQKVIPNYNGELEFGNGEVNVSFIGDIAIQQATYDESMNELSPPIMAGFQHANLQVPLDFDESIFETLTNEPKHPVRIFA